MRGETRKWHPNEDSDSISIHSPHARGDDTHIFFGGLIHQFQSTPFMRGETLLVQHNSMRLKFQSTPLMRGETTATSPSKPHKPFQSTPLMRGETTWRAEARIPPEFQSTPLMRGETCHDDNVRQFLAFQSTPLMRGETRLQRCNLVLRQISIHSPHARGDGAVRPPGAHGEHFNPLPSCEGRQHKPPKIHPDLRQLTQQNHDTPLFWALQAPFCGAKPDIRGAKPTGKP